MAEYDEPEPLTHNPFAGLAEKMLERRPTPEEAALELRIDSGALLASAGWLGPADLVGVPNPLEIPLLQIERGGITFPRPGEPLTPEQAARHERMKRWEQERWAEDWLTWPVLDALSWYCARCRFTGPAAEHPDCGNTQLERVRVTVTRYFPPEDDDGE